MLAWLWVAKAHASPKMGQAVIVQLKLADDAFGAEGESFSLYDVEDALSVAVKGHGELDGHEIGSGYFTIYLYGSDAEALFAAIQPTLRKAAIRAGSFVRIRKGGPGAPERKVTLRS